MTSTISRTFQFTNINRISFSALGNIRLIQCEEESVVVEGSEEALDHIKISQESDTIQIRLYTWYDFLFIPRPAVYTIRVKNLEAFSIAGSAEMDCESIDACGKPFDLSTSGSGRIRIDALKAQDLNISSSGSGNYDIRSVETTKLKAGISGSGNFRFAGTAESIGLNISGSGEIDAADLAVKKTAVHISGAGRITTQVSDQLDVHISGSGEVIYVGDPQVTHSISGSGKVRRR
jgi:hypothetical protein